MGDQYSVLFHYYSLFTVTPRGLHAKLCHAFLVSVLISVSEKLQCHERMLTFTPGVYLRCRRHDEVKNKTISELIAVKKRTAVYRRGYGDNLFTSHAAGDERGTGGWWTLSSLCCVHRPIVCVHTPVIELL